jgi:hypothetical protein
VTATGSVAPSGCLAFDATWVELASDVVPGRHAYEQLTELKASTNSLEPTVNLRAYPSADIAAGKIAVMRSGVSSCSPHSTMLPDPGLGDDSMGFTEVFGPNRQTLLAARVGAVVATVEVSGPNSADQQLTALLHTLAAKQVDRLRAGATG